MPELFGSVRQRVDKVDRHPLPARYRAVVTNARPQLFWPIVAVFAAIPAVGSLWGFMVDDALISARVASNLHTGVGYRFNGVGSRRRRSDAARLGQLDERLGRRVGLGHVGANALDSGVAFGSSQQPSSGAASGGCEASSVDGAPSRCSR